MNRTALSLVGSFFFVLGCGGTPASFRGVALAPR
jgi:hypothetical protein